jgi:hypothetical protein
MVSAFVKKFTGKMVIWGKPSKDFHPYMPLNKGAVKSLHDARDKLLVNFDPTAYFVRDLKVTLKIDLKYVLPFTRLFIYAFIQKIISVYLQCAFPKTFKLWYGSVGGDAVGLTWENLKVLNPTAWAVESALFFSERKMHLTNTTSLLLQHLSSFLPSILSCRTLQHMSGII